jgi:CRISPR-associated protein Csm3
MKIIKLEGKIKLISGLHIGGGDDTMKIGGIDNGVVKDVNSDKPYIPGSSLKGKMRSLLEWDIGVVNLNRNEKEKGSPLSSKHIWEWDNDKKSFNKDKFIDVAFEDEKLFSDAQTLLKLFGDKEGEFGITRISVGDCKLIEKDGQETSEAKYENVIDRRNGTAQHPRQTERVPADVEFKYDIRLKILDEDDENALKQLIVRGLELVEDDYLGGNGSRGYGRVEFSNKNEWKE